MKPTPPRRSREQAKRVSRAALIDSAIELFARDGLDVSLDEICAHAGYTRGAFYVSFKDRDQLLAAVMERVGDGMFEAMRENSQHNDLHSVSRRFMQVLTTGRFPLASRGGIRPHQLLDACSRSPEIREQYTSLLQNSAGQLAGSIRESQRLSQVRGDIEADQFSPLLLAAVIGMHLLNDLEVPFDLSIAVQALFKLLAPLS